MFIIYSAIPPVLQDMRAEMPIDCLCHKLILTIESVAYTIMGPYYGMFYQQSCRTYHLLNLKITFQCCTVDLYINNIIN